MQRNNTFRIKKKNLKRTTKKLEQNSKETGNKSRNTDETQEWETDVDNLTTEGKTHRLHTQGLITS